MRFLSNQEITDREFANLKKLIEEKCGIHMSDTKRRLLQNRLSRRLIEKGLASFSEYYRYLMEKDKDGSEVRYLLDRISTNKTDFFRENEHFAFMKNAILPMIEQKKLLNHEFFLRIWSAGCSSGEEAYSIAMTIKEYFKQFNSAQGRILATDLSTLALEKARTGTYSCSSVAKIGAERKERFFTPTKRNKEIEFKVKDEIRELIEFRYFNLISPHFPFKHEFDVIFCRNVMMFMDQDVQKSLIDKFSSYLKVGGYLITGLAENFSWMDAKFTYVKNSIYLREHN